MQQKLQKSQQKGLIYLLMGYLGSGKTTFIRNILNNKAGKKYAIIQNEFASGEMGIQQPLIIDQSGIPFSNFLQLPNGCICCSAKNDLTASIEYILANTSVRRIIVQTNGLADPSQSIKQFWFDQQMKINSELHSVISIFNVQKFNEMKNMELFEKQIVFANKVLITFVDKCEEKDVEKLQSYVRDSNKQCEIKRNDNYDIVSFLEGQKIFDIGNFAINSKAFSQSKQQTQSLHPSHHNIHSLFFTCPNISISSKTQIQQSIGQLLWQSGLKILRIKGIYSLPSFENILQLQGVDDLFQIKQTNTNKQKCNNQTKILIIGQNIEGQYQNIKKMLKMNKQ